MPAQNVNLTETLDHFVKAQVESGLFNNASEVHRAALAQMAQAKEERDLRLAKLRQDIATGDTDVAAGRLHEYDSADALYADIVK